MPLYHHPLRSWWACTDLLSSPSWPAVDWALSRAASHPLESCSWWLGWWCYPCKPHWISQTLRMRCWYSELGLLPFQTLPKLFSAKARVTQIKLIFCGTLRKISVASGCNFFQYLIIIIWAVAKQIWMDNRCGNCYSYFHCSMLTPSIDDVNSCYCWCWCR